MRLVSCLGISDEGLCNAVRKLPLLEELDISYSKISKVSLEAVGRSCPILKSLNVSRTKFDCFVIEDDEAVVIAETMSGLRHLDIQGSDITNVGLIAILDGCPLLESLNILECIFLDLSGSLKERCLQQIKVIRLPIHDSCVDYNYFNRVCYHYNLCKIPDFDPSDLLSMFMEETSDG